MTIPHLTRPNLLPERPPLKKIAFEEHFLLPEAMKKKPDGSIDMDDFNFHAVNNGLTPEWFKQVYDRLMDFTDVRIPSMNESNIEYSILSLMCPGIGSMTDKQKAEDTARAVNDALAEKISEHPDRFGGFASLAIHDPDKAAKELERCVKKLGFKGVMVNGYYQVDREDNLVYLDDERCEPIWAALQELDVPVYLHPRTSYEQKLYGSHHELVCANWGYACETGTHAVRILVSGVFDRFPKAKLIIGHNGETIPFGAWRLQHWMEFNPGKDRPKKRIGEYLRDNVYTTISGDWSVPALLCTMQVMGTDRMLFSVDYPFENMDEASAFLDNAPISESDRVKLANENACKLFRLPTKVVERVSAGNR
jgi:gamma-resorcylate decarboxylase